MKQLNSVHSYTAFVEIAAHANEGPQFDSQTYEVIGHKTYHVVCPYAYGFILNTFAPDDAELDCYIISDTKLNAGSVIEVEAIGGVEFFDEGIEDHKILCREIGSNSILTETIKQNILQFSDAYFANMPNRNVHVGNFFDKETANTMIQTYSV